MLLSSAVIPLGHGPSQSTHLLSRPAWRPAPQSCTQAPRSAIRCATTTTTTSCHVNGSERPHSCCPPVNNIKYIKCGDSVAEWLACCAVGPGFKSQPRRCRVTVLGKRFIPIVPPVHQAAKLVAALLMVARVTAGLAESNGRLPPGL